MEVLRPAATTGERIGPYEVLDRVADSPLGALEIAYVSSGVEEGRIVFLERIPVAAKDPVHARVLKTSLTARSVRHPRIVAVLEAISRPADVVIASEQVESVSLRSLMRRAFVERAPLPPPVALSIAIDVVRALKGGSEAWRKLGAQAVSVHGGLIPDVVLLASFGDTLLTNVGISSLLLLQTPLGTHVDVLPYRAPESLAGKADERADVYGVGVLLWEMLANRPLFGGRDRFVRIGSDAAAVRREVMEQKAPRLDAIVRGGPPIPGMLIEIVQQLLARDPASRFPTLGALLSALEKLGGDLSATPEQIGAAVTRLAEKQLDAQRNAIERVAVADRKSLSPESTRSTGRPAPFAEGEAPRLVVPKFPAEEAPTARRRQPTPPLVAAPMVAIPPPPRLVRPAPPPRAMPVIAVSEPISEVHAIEDAPSGIIERTSPLPSVNEPAPEPISMPEVPVADPPLPAAVDVAPVALSVEVDKRRRWLVALVAVLVLGAGVLIAIALSTRRPSSPVVSTENSAPPTRVVESARVPAPTAKPEASERAVAPETPAPSETRDTVRGPAQPGPATSRPTQKKPYRPRGI